MPVVTENVELFRKEDYLKKKEKQKLAPLP